MSLKKSLQLFDPESETDRIVQFISEKQDQIGSSAAVVGLSGGIDSSVTAVLALKSLPHGSVEIVFLPENTTPQRDREDVVALEEKFGLDVRRINIDGFVSDFAEKIPEELSEIARANVKARVRMTVLYAVANQSGGIVLGTGNLSEWLLGYFTKYGDGAADIAPIVHLYKTELKRLAGYLEIPESIIEKPPSAGLWEGQTDEAELGASYEQIDRILYCRHSLGLSKSETKKNLDLGDRIIERIFAMVDNSSHKRENPDSLTRS